MKFLFFFLDGVGLGKNDPKSNPFAQAKLPTLERLLGGQRLLIETLSPPTNYQPATGQPFTSINSEIMPLALVHDTPQATLLALDPCLGVPGIPQSATGQATLLTGINVPAALGYHYGPKPNQPVARLLQNGTLFHKLTEKHWKISLLNAYPPTYFRAIESGHRIFSAIPLVTTRAGIALNTMDDLLNGKALSADFTGLGWRERLGIANTPLLTPEQAGERMATLAGESDLSFFEYWLSDYAGHKQDMDNACDLLETFDRVLAGLISNWNQEDGLILITSDHGNLEDLSTRRHTRNPVLALIIGSPQLRQNFTQNLVDLTSITPAILNLFS
jgi:2,3-bisphosphoglycerate-independent phosphoglycerate mutase